MHTKLLLVAFALCTFSVKAQTLFTYGNKAVSRQEFLTAFNKNPDTAGNRAEKLQQYLSLYENFKLKIQAAYDEKLHATSQFKLDAENFRDQLTENYINEQANIHQLVHEAFLRSQKDILIAEIFVENKTGDTTAAYGQIQKAYKSLAAGNSFEKTVQEFSTDTAEKLLNGIVGYITVFSLPYEVENILYNLKPGSYSTIYHSGAGYHIFKNISERPAMGKRKIQQILFPIPSFFSSEDKARTARTADSVYLLLKNGASFTEMVRQFSSAGNNAYEPDNIIDISVGQYSKDFEDQVFAIKSAGDITQPFQTAYGFNIVKLISTAPVITNENDVSGIASLQEKVQADNRLGIAKDNLISKWLSIIHYKKYEYNNVELLKFIDSSLAGKPLHQYKSIQPTTVLFEFEKQQFTAKDFAKYISATGAAAIDSTAMNQLLKNFIKESCDKYYRAHIENFYPSITEQMREFNEANLLFAVMDKHVWSKSSEDSTGLMNYYKAHKEKYIWNAGLSALVVTAPTKEMAKQLAQKLKDSIFNWRNIIKDYDEIAADSSRFENGQLPVKAEVQLQQGFQTAPEKNEAGDGFMFMQILKIFPQPSQRSFDDARGMVINDYQQVVEEKWIAELKKKYPVKVNEAVVKTL